ncbi:MAG: CDP-glycerol glycerophosphotransferase family protein [Acutalibacteraceae bacterium]|nr:CDP-glycerol glycerophosphotransferase family protein [Acutalibacteraceae bacterium]
MKRFFYALYALFFNLSRILPVKENRIAFVAPHNGGNKDSLGTLRTYAEKSGKYDIVTISTRDLILDKTNLISSCLKAAGFFTLKAKALATSKYVFLNDNFMPMAKLKFSKKTVITQLWHAEGAFKKFGLSAPLTDDVREREKKCSANLTYIVCSSKNVAPIYAEAFGVDENKILPLGAPRIDSLLCKRDVSALRDEFDKKNPECKGKKLVLYAPTFRDDSETNNSLVKKINGESFRRELGDDYKLLIKLHPQIHSDEPVEGAVGVTSGYDIGELTLICDLLITDYSSVCMDFALLSKPCVFFAFDLEEYEKERSFYFDYESYVPGTVAKTFDEVINAIRNPQNDEEKLRRFREFNFDYVDCNNTKRIFDRIILNEKK